jgi:hypothetical protein
LLQVFDAALGRSRLGPNQAGGDRRKKNDGR